MKKLILLSGILIILVTLLAQEESYDVTVVNIEVPVRVYKGNIFVDNLTIDDFEVYEDGKLQKIVAVYLVKKTKIEREETVKEKKEPTQIVTPVVSRNFVLLFEIIDYMPDIGEAFDYFFENVIMPGDTLKVVTPMKTYDLKSEAFEKLPKEKIAEQLKQKVRKDVIKGNAKFKALIQEFFNLDKQDFTEVEDLKRRFQMEILRQLRDYKQFDEEKLQNFADYLKNIEGQKHIILFYQKENVPRPKNLSFFEQAELMKNISFDENKIRKALSDSSISVHFLYITKDSLYFTDPSELESRAIRAIIPFDQSHAIFGAFNKMAQVTGGLSYSSADIAGSLKRAVDASENYYLLYYRPTSYRADGKFRRIKVKIKNKNYRVTHRSGYFAK